MESWKPRAAIHTGIAATLAAPAAASPAPDLPDNVIEWLVQATLMYGVPFVYMVPDARMLPPESLRFFYVDRNWLDRLVDGALSIGTNSSKDNAFNEQFFEAVYNEMDQQQAQYRATLRKRTIGAGTPAGGPMSGLLFRSVIVSTWPGVEIQPTVGGAAVPILRMDRLSPDVLLVIFNGVPDTVNIVEPSEGLHMGVVDTPPVGTNVKVVLRGLGTGGFDAGVPIPDGQGYLAAYTTLRTGAASQPEGVLDIGALVTSMQTTLQKNGALSGSLTPGGFAIEIVLGAGLQEFSLGAPDRSQRTPPAPTTAGR